MFATYDFETDLWEKGFELVAGIDEVGRGSWAGPVVAGAVILPREPITGLKDSKLLSPKQREFLDKIIREKALAIGIGLVDLPFINKNGIGLATQQAFRLAYKNLTLHPHLLIIDAFYIRGLDQSIQKPIKDGDKLSASIAAASIVAKVFRDNLMIEMHRQYPEYGFDRHKGYGTKFHQEMIRKYGFCDLHRKSFDLGYLFNEQV